MPLPLAASEQLTMPCVDVHGRLLPWSALSPPAALISIFAVQPRCRRLGLASSDRRRSIARGVQCVAGRTVRGAPRALHFAASPRMRRPAVSLQDMYIKLLQEMRTPAIMRAAVAETYTFVNRVLDETDEARTAGLLIPLSPLATL